MQAIGWSDDRVQVLRTMWAEGFSAGQIALRLGGVTRNAVIGKVHRLGLAGRKTPLSQGQVRRIVERRKRPRVRSAPHPRPPSPHTVAAELAAIAALPPLDPGLGVLGLNQFTCRYPIGDPQEAGFAFCGRTCDAEASYCCDHARLCYVPPKPPQPRQRSIRPDWREGMAA